MYAFRSLRGRGDGLLRLLGDVMPLLFDRPSRSGDVDGSERRISSGRLDDRDGSRFIVAMLAGKFAGLLGRWGKVDPLGGGRRRAVVEDIFDALADSGLVERFVMVGDRWSQGDGASHESERWSLAVGDEHVEMFADGLPRDEFDRKHARQVLAAFLGDLRHQRPPNLPDAFEVLVETEQGTERGEHVRTNRRSVVLPAEALDHSTPGQLFVCDMSMAGKRYSLGLLWLRRPTVLPRSTAESIVRLVAFVIASGAVGFLAADSLRHDFEILQNVLARPAIGPEMFWTAPESGTVDVLVEFARGRIAELAESLRVKVAQLTLNDPDRDGSIVLVGPAKGHADHPYRELTIDDSPRVFENDAQWLDAAGSRWKDSDTHIAGPHVVLSRELRLRPGQLHDDGSTARPLELRLGLHGRVVSSPVWLGRSRYSQTRVSRLRRMEAYFQRLADDLSALLHNSLDQWRRSISSVVDSSAEDVCQLLRGLFQARTVMLYAELPFGFELCGASESLDKASEWFKRKPACPVDRACTHRQNRGFVHLHESGHREFIRWPLDGSQPPKTTFVMPIMDGEQRIGLLRVDEPRGALDALYRGECPLPKQPSFLMVHHAEHICHVLASHRDLVSIRGKKGPFSRWIEAMAQDTETRQSARKAIERIAKDYPSNSAIALQCRVDPSTYSRQIRRILGKSGKKSGKTTRRTPFRKKRRD